MAEYVKTTWIDEGEPAIDAEKLNKIEEGIRNMNDFALVIALGGQIYI